MTTIHFLGEECTLEWGWYAKPRNRRLQLWASDGPMATASLNPATSLPDGFIAIKDYRENAGILAALVAAGAVEDTGDLVPVGYEMANLCVILARK